MPTLKGTIVSSLGKNTVVVTIGRVVHHPKYKKIIKQTTRLAVHNDLEGLNSGDQVEIVQSRPYSKTKHFKVTKKV